MDFTDAHIECYDNRAPEGSTAATWGKTTFGCAKRSGRPIDTLNTMCASIEEAGFVHVHEKGFRLPIGPWAKGDDPKETGMFNYHIWSSGLYVCGLSLNSEPLVRSPADRPLRMLARLGRKHGMGKYIATSEYKSQLPFIFTRLVYGLTLSR